MKKRYPAIVLLAASVLIVLTVAGVWLIGAFVSFNASWASWAELRAVFLVSLIAWGIAAWKVIKDQADEPQISEPPEGFEAWAARFAKTPDQNLLTAPKGLRAVKGEEDEE